MRRVALCLLIYLQYIFSQRVTHVVPQNFAATNGASLTLAGNNFGVVDSSLTSYIASRRSSTVSWTSVSSVVMVGSPGSGKSRSISTVVFAGDSLFESINLVTFDAPVLTAPLLSNGPVYGGTSVSIRGLNFGAVATSPSAAIASTQCTTTVWHSTTSAFCLSPRGGAFRHTSFSSIRLEVATLSNFYRPLMFAYDEANCYVDSDCSGHGECFYGLCSCSSDYWTPSCSVFCSAEATCSSHGSCRQESGTCACAGNFVGAACSTCAVSYFGPNCDIFCHWVQTCSSQGLCHVFKGTCECFGIFAGVDCTLCQKDYYSKTCSVYCVAIETCSGHGECSPAGLCDCAGQYDGHNCDRCRFDRFYGTDCTVFCDPVVSCFGRATCSPRTGECACFSRFKGTSCESCVADYYGFDCTTFCSSSVTCRSHGECNSVPLCVCAPSFQGEFCTDCADGLYGPVCSVVCLAGLTCNNRGTCHPLTGACECASGFQGTYCENCSPNYFGQACTTFCDRELCLRRGVCDPRGNCFCDLKFTGERCEHCKSGFFGFNCDVLCDCQGHGSCTFEGNCICDGNYAGEHCTECLPSWFGATCNHHCDDNQECRGNGVCDAVGRCVCSEQYSGSECADCIKDFYGPTCLKYCLAGETCPNPMYCDFETGNCLCPGGFDPPCDLCGTFYYGANCLIFCDATKTCNAHGSCHRSQGVPCECNGNFAGVHCDECKDGFFGEACAALCIEGTTCPPPKVCDSLTGECRCSGRREGADCEMCAANYYPAPDCTVYCESSETCLGHGLCDRFTGLCRCTGFYSGSDCLLCQPFYFGSSCSKFCNAGFTCRGHGQCTFNATCLCDERFVGVACDTCFPNYVGEACDIHCNAAVQCAGHGLCDHVSGECLCFARFRGQDCSTCQLDYYGPACGTYCHIDITCSSYGSCTTNGTCLCDGLHVGADCGDCRPGFFGDDCDRPCSRVLCSSHGDCDSNGDCFCDEHFAGEVCDHCSVSYFGQNCTSFCVASVTCRGHGLCNSQGICKCSARFGGDHCSDCISNYHGASCSLYCNETVTCHGHGDCLADGSCGCLPQFKSPHCVWCVPGLVGPNCDIVCSPETHCSSHGMCTPTGQCQCYDRFRAGNCSLCEPSWFGSNCNVFCDPVLNCTANATCSLFGKCVCDPSEGCQPCVDSDCNGWGLCGSNDVCLCDNRHTGPFCAECLEGYYGSACDVVCSPNLSCSGHGVCSADGSCRCDLNFDGPNCDRCRPYVYGTSCDIFCYECSGNGVCANNGSCVCEWPWSGTECRDCRPNYFGPACEHFCSVDHCSGRGSCDSSGQCVCLNARFLGELCDFCVEGLFDPHCNQTLNLTVSTAAGPMNLPVNIMIDEGGSQELYLSADPADPAFLVVAVDTHPLTGTIPSLGSLKMQTFHLGFLEFNVTHTKPGAFTILVSAVDPDYVGKTRAVISFLLPTLDMISMPCKFSVRNLNDAPDTRDDSFVVVEDIATDLDVLVNDTDVDGDAIWIWNFTSPRFGILTLSRNGTRLTFSPSTNYVGTVAFDYWATDGQLWSRASVSIVVSPVNDLPETKKDKFTVFAGESRLLPVLDNDQDPDGDALHLVPHSSLVPEGITTWIEDGRMLGVRVVSSFEGTALLHYLVSDPNHGTSVGEVTLIVLPRPAVTPAPKLPAGLCANNCSGHGICLSEQNDCDCHVGYFRLDCSGELLEVTSISGDVDESGKQAFFDIYHMQMPTAVVTCALFTSDASEGSVLTHVVLERHNNHLFPVRVNVTGLPDRDPDGDVEFSIHLGPCQSEDERFDGVSRPSLVTVVNRDVAFPYLDKVLPPTLPLSGNIPITLTGENFYFRCRVLVGGIEVSSYVNQTLLEEAERAEAKQIADLAESEAAAAEYEAALLGARREVGSRGLLQSGFDDSNAVAEGSVAARLRALPYGPYSFEWSSTMLRFRSPVLPASGYADIIFVNTDGGQHKAPSGMYVHEDCRIRGSYGSATSCKECPVGAYCPGGNRLHPLRGYWSPTVDVGPVMRCSPMIRCLGSARRLCAPYHHGILCTQCLPDSYMMHAMCYPCRGTSTMVLVRLLLQALFAGALILSLLFLSNFTIERLVNHALFLQLVFFLGQALHPSIPPNLQLFFSWIGLFAFDPRYALPGCGTSSSRMLDQIIPNMFYMLSILAIPLFLLFGALVFLRALAAHRQRQRTWLGNRIVFVAWQWYTLCHMPLCSLCLLVLRCGTVMEQYVHYDDPTTVCWTGDHLTLGALALPLLLVLTANMFVLPLRIHFAVRHGTVVSPAFLARYGSYASGFRPKFLPVISIIFLLHFVVVLVANFGQDHAAVQASFVFPCCVAFIVFIWRKAPLTTRLQNMSLWVRYVFPAVCSIVNILVTTNVIDPVLVLGMLVMVFCLVALLSTVQDINSFNSLFRGETRDAKAVTIGDDWRKQLVRPRTVPRAKTPATKAVVAPVRPSTRARRVQGTVWDDDSSDVLPSIQNTQPLEDLKSNWDDA